MRSDHDSSLRAGRSTPRTKALGIGKVSSIGVRQDLRWTYQNFQSADDLHYQRVLRARVGRQGRGSFEIGPQRRIQRLEDRVCGQRGHQGNGTHSRRLSRGRGSRLSRGRHREMRSLRMGDFTLNSSQPFIWSGGTDLNLNLLEDLSC